MGVGGSYPTAQPRKRRPAALGGRSHEMRKPDTYHGRCMELHDLWVGPATVQVSVLGTFDFAAADGSRPPLSGGAQRLLAYLALRGGAVSRAATAGSLWPEVSDEHASSSLRAALSRLDAATRDALSMHASTLQLADDVAVDIARGQDFARRLVGADDAPDADAAPAAAISVLTRDVLPDWYDEWVVPEADDWRQLRVAALEALSLRLAAAGKFAHAMSAALSAVRVDPLREQTVAALIRVHLAEGNRADALFEFRRYRARVLREIGAEPTDALYELVGIAPAATRRRNDAPPERTKWEEVGQVRDAYRRLV